MGLIVNYIGKFLLNTKKNNDGAKNKRRNWRRASVLDPLYGCITYRILENFIFMNIGIY